MLKYKDILVAKGSALYDAMTNKSVAVVIEGQKKKNTAEQVYKETTLRYKAMHSKEDRDWFAEMSKA